MGIDSVTVTEGGRRPDRESDQGSSRVVEDQGSAVPAATGTGSSSGTGTGAGAPAPGAQASDAQARIPTGTPAHAGGGLADGEAGAAARGDAGAGDDADPERLWWPHFDGPQDVTAIEAIPLADRKLPNNTYEILDRAARKWPDHEALVLLPSAQRWDDPVIWTFDQLRRRVHQVANLFTSLGVTRRDAVGLLSPNCGDVITTLLAAQAVGIVAPVNPGLTADTVADLVAASGSVVLVAAGPELDPQVWQTALKVAADERVRAVLALRPDGVTGSPPPLSPPPRPGVVVGYLDELRAGHPDDRLLAADRAAPTDLASYFHTGGTTGRPKLAAHTHANEVVSAWSLALSSALPQHATVLAGLPLFHVNAVMVSMMTPLMRGRRTVWTGPRGFRDPEIYRVFWKVVERYRVASLSAVPTIYAALAEQPVDADISSLVIPTVGAAPLPAEVGRRFTERTGLKLYEGYGLTEATCASARSMPGNRRPGTSGQRLPYQHIKAVRIDDDGTWHDLPPGETGVLVISGPLVFAGYLRPGPDGRPVPDPSGVVVDGWLNTGDLGSVDAEGYVRLAGRHKDLIIRGGHNIDPIGIENALLTHADVVAAAAVGRPDAHAGEVPVAYVVTRPGAAVDAEELRRWAAERVPERAAAPKAVYLVDALPTTLVGKIFKPALRADAAQRVVGDVLTSLGHPGLAGSLAVEQTGDRPTVVVPASDDPETDEKIRAELDRYPITWRFAAAAARD